MIKITFHYRYRKQIIIASAILILIVTTSIVYINIRPKEKPKIKEEKIALKKEKKETKEEAIEEYKVDIKGEVINLGIYTLKKYSRIIDCIELAGGLTENANTTVLNLSKKITDEMVIIVYSNAEVAEFKKTKELEKQVQDSCIQKNEDSLKNDACIDDDSSNTSLISINTATEDELSSLSGIGPSKAKQIVEYRTTNGPFKTIEDIKQVPGIGDSIFAQIKDYITI